MLTFYATLIYGTKEEQEIKRCFSKKVSPPDRAKRTNLATVRKSQTLKRPSSAPDTSRCCSILQIIRAGNRAENKGKKTAEMKNRSLKRRSETAIFEACTLACRKDEPVPRNDIDVARMSIHADGRAGR